MRDCRFVGIWTGRVTVCIFVLIASSRKAAGEKGGKGRQELGHLVDATRVLIEVKQQWAKKK